MARTKGSTPQPRMVSQSSQSLEGHVPSPEPSHSSQIGPSSIAPSSETSKNIEQDISHDDESVKERSFVWRNDFDKVYITDKNGEKVLKAQCKHCKSNLSFKPGAGTSHLKRHAEIYCKKKKRSGNESKKELEVFTFNQDISRKRLATLIICAELPFRLVEHPAFVDFVRSLQPLFQLVGRLTVRNDCVALYEEEKRKLHTLLKNLKCRVSFTSDMWTSNQKLGYMTLTAHYIDDDFFLRRKILSFKKVPYPHTGYAISEIIWNSILDWELDNKVLALTLDNASTNDSVITRIRGHYGEKMLLNGVHMHIRCCTHILNILVQDGLRVMQDSIENIRNVIRYVDATPSRMQVFNEIAQMKRLPVRKGLVLDISTRWNSTHDMFANALRYKDVLTMYVQEHGQSFLALTHDDWIRAQSVCNFLKHFLDATLVFSGFKYSTSNLYFKEVWNIRRLLLEEAQSSDRTITNMALEMQKKFDKYWRHCNKFLCVASVLDPRLKLGYISFSYQKAFGEEDAKERVDDIRKLLNDIYFKYEREANEDSNSIVLTPSDGSSSMDVMSSKRIHDMEYMQWWSVQQKAKRPRKDELDSYLGEPSLALLSDEGFSVLNWWKKNATVYPILARMARDFLAVPVSTVSSESAFSTGGRVIDPHRSRLNPETIEALICAQDWLHQNFNLDQDAFSGISTLAEELDSEQVDVSREFQIT